MIQSGVYVVNIHVFESSATVYRALGFRFVRLDGTMSMKQRLRSVEEFSNPAPGSPTIMLLSLKAGGVGINLVAASRVFLMDPVCRLIYNKLWQLKIST